jgi:hypothetical protein
MSRGLLWTFGSYHSSQCARRSWHVGTGGTRIAPGILSQAVAIRADVSSDQPGVRHVHVAPPRGSSPTSDTLANPQLRKAVQGVLSHAHASTADDTSDQTGVGHVHAAPQSLHHALLPPPPQASPVRPLNPIPHIFLYV